MSEENTAIGELMARDPTKLTSQDLDKIVAELRKQRHRFVMVNDKTVGKPETKKSAAQKKREADIKGAGISIDDLLSGI